MQAARGKSPKISPVLEGLEVEGYQMASGQFVFFGLLFCCFAGLFEQNWWDCFDDWGLLIEDW